MLTNSVFALATLVLTRKEHSVLTTLSLALRAYQHHQNNVITTPASSSMEKVLESFLPFAQTRSFSGTLTPLL